MKNSYDLEKVDQKSKEFLKRIMGDERFNKLQKDGKIEIEVENKSNNKSPLNIAKKLLHQYNNDKSNTDKIIYELYDDGRLINKTKNQSYCIVADRMDYPIDDLIAIKYSWLIHKNDIVEKVANKTHLYTGITNRTDGVPIHVAYSDFIRDMEQRGWNRQQINITNNDDNNLNATTIPWYGDYVDYLTSNGWHRELKTIDQNNTYIVATNNVYRDNTDCIVDVRCPAGMKMSIMGMRQIPPGADTKIAYTLGLYIIDDNGEEIQDTNKMRITKVKPSADVIQLARFFYKDIKMTEDKETSYTFQQGIELNGEDHLCIYITNSQNNISSENVKFKMETDIWARN